MTPTCTCKYPDGVLQKPCRSCGRWITNPARLMKTLARPNTFTEQRKRTDRNRQRIARTRRRANV